MDKIICAGKNYLEHAQEMQEGTPEKPVLFLKPPSTLVTCSEWNQRYSLTLPPTAKKDEIHYECELVFLIQRDGYCFSPEEAQQALSHVTIGLDLTNRTLQSHAKKAAAPWEIGKVFPQATVIGPWLPWDKESALSFSYAVNDVIKQQAHSTQMRLNPIELLVYASQYFPICRGDLLFTGTPAGVGAIHPGDIGTLRLQEWHYQVMWE